MTSVYYSILITRDLLCPDYRYVISNSLCDASIPLLPFTTCRSCRTTSPRKPRMVKALGYNDITFLSYQTTALLRLLTMTTHVSWNYNSQVIIKTMQRLDGSCSYGGDVSTTYLSGGFLGVSPTSPKS
ncbi:hypothetical protein GDO81_029884 [Engystomops pustulosus]|uniref:Uncharacterized protein n=1 Tax=Engystomops pustulosus TaxID=76066 RepID=A0AAV6ZEV0_ENGPU|nr:hypothetical protein GDO81_029884 [Engystomops pustulosus]